MSYQIFTTRPGGRPVVRSRRSRIEAGLAALQGVTGGAMIAAALLAVALALAGCASVPPPRAAGQVTPRAAQAAPQPRQAQPQKPMDPDTALALLLWMDSYAAASRPAYSPPPQVVYAPAPQPPQYAPAPLWNLNEPVAPAPTVWRPRGFEHLNH